MSLQNNTLYNGFHGQGILQPYFFLLAGVTILLWLVSNLVKSGELLYIVIAIFTYILTVISSLPVFCVWKYTSNRSTYRFLGSYAAWMVISPVVWFGGYYLFLNTYAIVVSKYGFENMQYQVTLWSILVDLLHSTITATVFVCLLLYISIWLTLNLQNARYLKRVAKSLSAFSGVFYVLLIVAILSG